MDQEPASRLAHVLRSRHVAFDRVRRVFGTGLFAGSVTILAAGPAMLISYASAGPIVLFVICLLGEMIAARPAVGSFHAQVGRRPGAQRGQRRSHDRPSHQDLLPYRIALIVAIAP